MAGGDVNLGDKIIADGEAVYVDAAETVRAYNDGGLLKIQIQVGGSWVDYHTYGE